MELLREPQIRLYATNVAVSYQCYACAKDLLVLNIMFIPLATVFACEKVENFDRIHCHPGSHTMGVDIK